MSDFDWPDQPTPAQIQALLAVPRDFGMSSGHPKSENPDTWAIGPAIRTRDSTLMELANATSLEDALAEEDALEGTWSIETHSHWACGWVDQICFQLLDEKGAVTPIYRWLAKWYRALMDYPVADDEVYSQMVYDATLDNIRDEGRRRVSEDAPDGWASDVYSWFSDNDPGAIESVDDQGGYPSREQMTKALSAFGWLKGDDE